jgi:hypothetical protein
MVMMKESTLIRYLSHATDDMIQNNRKEIRCPCQKCKLRTLFNPFFGKLLEHLLMSGFMDGHTQWMGEDDNNNNNNNNVHNNNNPPPPPPPPPPHVDMLTRFLRLRPSTFTSSFEPIVADDWLHSVNKNLVTIGCTDAEKVRFASHLLEGPTTSWWENYQITHPIEEVNWDMFQEAFYTAHISSRVMSLKKREFRNFRQGHRTVAEYIDEFNKLARYAPDDVDTDAKRRERFLDGLDDELGVQLSVVYAPNYQALIDKATILENKHNQMENRKRKFHNQHGGNGHKNHNGNHNHGVSNGRQ